MPLRLGTERPREPISPWIRWSVTILSYLSVLILGFLISWFVFPHFVGIPVDPRTGQPLMQYEFAPPASSQQTSPQQQPPATDPRSKK